MAKVAIIGAAFGEVPQAWPNICAVSVWLSPRTSLRQCLLAYPERNTCSK